MTSYTNGTEVYELLLNLQVGPPARFTIEDVEPIVDGLEAQVNSVLRAQQYSPIPATQPEAVTQIGQMVRRKAAVIVYQLLFQVERSPDWVRSWDIDFSEWMEALRKGEILLVDQEPEGEETPYFGIVRHPTRDDYFTERGGTTDWDE